MFTIACPQCGVNTSLSFLEPIYRGPFRCWKCRGAFLIELENEALKSWRPMTEEELNDYMEQQR
jgi:transposase-like protein